MAKAENDVTALVRLKHSELGDKLFRNNIGLGWLGRMIKEIPRMGERPDVLLKSPHKVKFGLFPGSADLIGWRSIVITPEMVGRRVAVFLSAEAKSRDGELEPDQATWLNNVRAAGGIAYVARGVDSVPESWEFPSA